MKKLDGKSLDIKEQNIQKLKELFPEVFSEGKIDFSKLQEKLGEFVEDENERYNFTWNGKQNAKKIAQTPSTGTLRPSCIVIHPTNAWKYSEETHLQHIEENRLYWGKDGNNTYPRLKRFLSEMDNGMVPVNFWTRQEAGTTDEASKNLENIMDLKVFDFPKPITLIMKAMRIAMKQEDLILDFFSGSATTAHAVMQLNAEDGGERKYICVQIPEPTDTKSEAYKAGYKNICEIGKERIRRAGEKIKEDNKDKDLSSLDTGFKVYKLDSSNIKEWDSDFDNLEENLLDAVDNIKADRTSEDLLYEILLKYGLDLTLPIEEMTIENKTVYNIGFGALVVCLDNEITISVVEKIAEFIKEQVIYDEEKKKRHSRVVFKDGSFKDSVVKTNAIQVLKQADIDEVVSV